MLKFVRKTRLFIGFLLFAAVVGCTSVPRSSDSDIVGAERVHALVPDAKTAADLRRIAIADGYEVTAETRLRGLGLTMLDLEMPEGVTGAQAITALEAAVPAATVGVNHAYRLQQETGGPGTLDYAGGLMRWPAGGCRARAPVGMIDTGIDVDSPALAQKRITARTFFSGRPAPATHGTDVAIVLSNPDRLSDVTIYAANVFGQQDALGLVAGADALVRALDWLAEEDVRFVNLALAGPYNKLLDLAVERAVARGLILVAAVGNDGPNAARLYPAGFDGVIAVTAVDATGRIYRNAVRGPHVDVAAPGVDVLVASEGGARFVTGTSIATPFVTARLAADASLVRARSVADVRARLAETSAELGPAGRDTTYGYGLTLAAEACGT